MSVELTDSPSTDLPSTDAAPAPARTPWLFIGLVTLAGLVVRAIPVVLADFPVNDGGLFVAMTEAIRDAGWGLPVSIAWNGADLPFAYPPLAFYAVGGLAALGADVSVVFQWLPLLASTLVVPAVFLLGRELLRSDLGGLVAAVAYALAPASFVWLIQGGGVTRAPGMLLAILGLWLVVRLVRAPGGRLAAAAGVLAGLTALTHPGAAVFLAISGGLIWVFEGRSRASLAWGAAAAGLGLAIAAPWLLLVVSRHGVGVLTDVPSNGPSLGAAILALGAGRVTGLPFVDPLAILGVALAVLAAVRRRFLLPIWLVAATVISYQYGMVPFSILIGAFAVDLAAARRRAAGPDAARASRIAITLVAGCLVLEGVASAGTVLNPSAPVHALDAARREANAWVAAELEPDARVAVITNSGWAGDPDSEWFPLLTGRQSVATVQGSEWLGQAAFEAQVQAHRDLQACVAEASVACVKAWLADHPADYLYLPFGRLHGPNSHADCCPDLREALLADPGFPSVYEGSGATVFSAGVAPGP